MTRTASAVAEPSAAPAMDRRRLERRPQVCETWIQCPTARPRPRHLPDSAEFCPFDSREVTSVNLSRHGVCFLTDRPLPIGAFQTIRVAMGESTLAGEVRILRCTRREDGDYEVGAEFC